MLNLIKFGLNTQFIDMEINLYDLPKISLNKWYAGVHWTKRKEIKDTYKLLIKSQFKQVLSKDNQYEVEYIFFFRIKPLDASNCVAMVKLIEDVIFEDDKWNIVLSIKIKSIKSKEDRVLIKLKEIQKVTNIKKKELNNE